MSSAYDGLIIGTGHNALVLQAYLCRCGLRVLSIDRATTPGGGLATIPNPRLPGYQHNTHSFFHRALTEMPWYTDLQLAQQGAVYVEPDLNVAMILEDGRSLQWWTDFERTYESFAVFSLEDADRLRRWREEFLPIVRDILSLEAQTPPLTEDRRERWLNSTAEGRRLLEVQRLSPLQFVQNEFRHPAVQAGLLFFNGLREVDLRLPGFGHSIPALLASDHMAQMCLGGSARLAQALVADIEAHGGSIRCDSELSQILVRNGRAVGVELADGERIETDGFVASGIDPYQTFVKLIPAEAAPATLRAQAEAFEFNLLAPLFALNVALDEPPRYLAAEDDASLSEAFMVILGLERSEQFQEIVQAHQAGQIPEPVMWGACPTLFDPTQAPSGGHTAFMWEKLPYAVHGDARNWDQLAEQHGQQLLERWAQYAPNLNHCVLDSFSRSPLDVERTLPNMRFGDLLVGSFANGQLRANRPFAGAGAYRTPVDGLYLCGGSTHPGGNITGLCGFNAAGVIAADLDCPLWWDPPEIESLPE